MRKILAISALMLILFIMASQPILANGDKVHGDKGIGWVYQQDPVGPGDQPDWQD